MVTNKIGALSKDCRGGATPPLLLYVLIFEDICYCFISSVRSTTSSIRFVTTE